MFCNVGPESIFHLFGTCEKLRVIWKIASETVQTLTQKEFDFSKARNNLQLDLLHAKLGKDNHFEKFLIYFNTIINYAIWKERNEIKFQFKRFECGNIIQRIIRTAKGRRGVDNKLIETRRIPYLTDFCSIFLRVCRRYFPFDNG